MSCHRPPASTRRGGTGIKRQPGAESWTCTTRARSSAPSLPCGLCRCPENGAGCPEPWARSPGAAGPLLHKRFGMARPCARPCCMPHALPRPSPLASCAIVRLRLPGGGGRCHPPGSWGTITLVSFDPVFPALSCAMMIMVYCRPSRSLPFRDAWSEIVKE